MAYVYVFRTLNMTFFILTAIYCKAFTVSDIIHGILNQFQQEVSKWEIK